MKKNICIISYSHIARDARVMRQVSYLSKKYRLTIIGYGSFHPDYLPSKDIHWIEISRGERNLRRRFLDLIRILRYLIGMVDRKQVLKAAIEAKADVYHANNWEALPVAAEAAKQNNAKLFLDIHESTKVSKGWLYELLNKIVVRRYSDEIDACSTVVDPIAKNYQQMFGLKPIIIRNIPELPATDIKFHLVDPEKIRLIHHGVAMPGRSPELMIRTLSKSKKNYELHLVFTNYSSKYVNSLQKLANEIAPKRVFFYPPYPIHEILTEISKYDIGFFPLPPNVYNYLIALPNKLFEFIAAGLAVCIGPSPSMAQVVRKYNCGIVAPTFNPEDLAQILNHTPVDKWNDMKKASLIASKELNADNEIEKLVKIYNQIINWN